MVKYVLRTYTFLRCASVYVWNKIYSYFQSQYQPPLTIWRLSISLYQILFKLKFSHQSTSQINYPLPHALETSLEELIRVLAR